jgi:hypothetical protein
LAVDPGVLLADGWVDEAPAFSVGAGLAAGFSAGAAGLVLAVDGAGALAGSALGVAAIGFVAERAAVLAGLAGPVAGADFCAVPGGGSVFAFTGRGAAAAGPLGATFVAEEARAGRGAGSVSVAAADFAGCLGAVLAGSDGSNAGCVAAVLRVRAGGADDAAAAGGVLAAPTVVFLVLTSASPFISTSAFVLTAGFFAAPAEALAGLLPV